MYNISEITIVISACLLVLSLIGIPFSVYFRLFLLQRNQDDTCSGEMDDEAESYEERTCMADATGESESVSVSSADGVICDKERVGESGVTPAVSVVLLSLNDADNLGRNLPAYLSQDSKDYEVIVVVAKNDADSKDIIEHYEDNPRLRTTFVVDSYRYMSRRKLAITLGVKAARSEWVVLSETAFSPASDHWLSAFCESLAENTSLVLGYNKLDDCESSRYEFEHNYSFAYIWNEAVKRRAYRTNSEILAFRKSAFMANEGFRSNLKYVRGEYDFLVNELASAGECTVAMNPDAWIHTSSPSVGWMRSEMLFYQETRLHLRKPFMLGLYSVLDQLSLHLGFVLPASVAAYSALVEDYVLLAVASFILLLNITLRLLFISKALRWLPSEQSSLSTLWKEFTHWMFFLRQYVAYKRADKYDFISHKI